jgi:hypothetical protein
MLFVHLLCKSSSFCPLFCDLLSFSLSLFDDSCLIFNHGCFDNVWSDILILLFSVCLFSVASLLWLYIARCRWMLLIGLINDLSDMCLSKTGWRLCDRVNDCAICHRTRLMIDFLNCVSVCFCVCVCVCVWYDMTTVCGLPVVLERVKLKPTNCKTKG